MQCIGATARDFRFITVNIDTTSPAGRMMIQMLGTEETRRRQATRNRRSVIPGCKWGLIWWRLYGANQPAVSHIVAAYYAGRA